MPDEVRKMRLDTTVGMFLSNAIAFFIIITVASTVGAMGSTQISTAADAANALRPFAGDFAFVLFALGIVGTGLLAVPVLAGSVAYAVAETFGWKAGLGKRFGQATGFYLVIAAVSVVGLLVNFTPIGPIKMLYYAAMLNGVLAPPLLIIILLIGNNKTILGDHTNGTFSNALIGATAVIMAGVGIATAATFFL